jgi:DNA-binding transcriptional ArsR family regulator
VNKFELKSLLNDGALGTPAGRIVRMLTERGAMSAAQLSRLTGLAKSTVSTAVSELRRSGMVLEAGSESGGSVGRPAYTHDQPHPHRVETGSPHARWAVVERTAHGWQAQLRSTAYDWHASADRAAALGFADWAHELRSGRAAP